jgi:hypothetical protein
MMPIPAVMMAAVHVSLNDNIVSIMDDNLR